MKLFQKRAIIGVLCLGVTFGASSAVGAFWPFSCDNIQTCKEKLDKNCALIEENETKCHEEYAELYAMIDKLTEDARALKESQILSEDIVTKLTAAYEEWKQDDFRIDTQYHTDYVLLKKKFTDQNRVVTQNEQIVKDDIRAMGKSLNSQSTKDKYMTSMTNAIDAYYKYNMAVAKEDMSSFEQ